MTLFLGIGGVGQQQPDPLVGGNGADTRQVGATPIDRGEVDLEVAGVQDHTLRCVDRNGVGVRHRVSDRDELDVERTDHAALAVLDDDQFGLAHQSRFFDAIASEAERDR